VSQREMKPRAKGIQYETPYLVAPRGGRMGAAGIVGKEAKGGSKGCPSRPKFAEGRGHVLV